jgi:hypothetical protein
MASYSKQMIDVAKEWLVANPDPDSPFINVPGLDKNGGQLGKAAAAAGDLSKYDAIAKKVPKAAPIVAELHQLVAEVTQMRSKLHTHEQTFEQIINAVPVPGHEKRNADERWHGDIGRWCLAWARHGYNVFDLSPDFTAAMLLTDARELDIAMIRLPFRGILMLIPDGFAKGIEGSSYTKIHLTEIPRADITQLSVANEVTDLIKNMTPASKLKLLDNVGRSLDDRPRSLIGRPKADPDDTAIHIHASDGAHVLDTLIERKGLTWDAFDALPDEVADDADRAARHTLRQIVFGTLAYVSAVTTELERPRFPPRPAGRKETATRWEIGRTIKLDGNLVRAVRGGAREVAYRLKHRHIVRGHYRNQAHGPARALRTMKWIMPFWKGPQDGAELVHTYKPTIEGDA